jgi:hypothetical protein
MDVKRALMDFFLRNLLHLPSFWENPCLLCLRTLYDWACRLCWQLTHLVYLLFLSVLVFRCVPFCTYHMHSLYWRHKRNINLSTPCTAWNLQGNYRKKWNLQGTFAPARLRESEVDGDASGQRKREILCTCRGTTGALLVLASFGSALFSRNGSEC